MKKVKRRATAALLIALLIIAGLCAYVIEFIDHGENWAMFPANQSVYSGGVLNTGTLTDRNGVLLAAAGNGVYYYSDDPETRIACLHAAGDYRGYIGTGAVTAFASKLAGYTPINGTCGDGETVALTIDSRLNVAACKALAGRKGAVLVMDYTTGEILCMVSSPSYDPNTSPDLTSDAYDGVFLNRAISSAFTPGSVFKLVTLAAAIENISDLEERIFYCSGSVALSDGVVTCSGTHGSQTIEQAFANSCNCAFAELAVELGPDMLERYSRELGLTMSHDLDGISTAAGNFEKAADSETALAWSGIGQHNDLVTPYSMLRLAAAIANGGVVAEPTLLMEHGILERRAKTRILKTGTAEALAEMMAYNVAYSYGDWRFPGLKICAKTGTAEVGDGSSHAWFAGFLNDEDNPLAFVVLVENGGGGLAAAAPVANTVLQEAVSR
jgi:peptidoglycan glycosyltransferase